jgi:hypothetical protein
VRGLRQLDGHALRQVALRRELARDEPLAGRQVEFLRVRPFADRHAVEVQRPVEHERVLRHVPVQEPRAALAAEQSERDRRVVGAGIEALRDQLLLLVLVDLEHDLVGAQPAADLVVRVVLMEVDVARERQLARPEHARGLHRVGGPRAVRGRAFRRRSARLLSRLHACLRH